MLSLPRRGQRSSGFTFVELLVVIGIILMLASILLPIASGARQQAHAVICQNHQRALWHGVMNFAMDNEGRLVGSQFDDANPIPSHRDFLRGSTSTWTAAPQAGTLFKYVNYNTSVYLCPSRTVDGTAGTAAATDLTSNGHFDYAIFLCFAGCKLEHLPTSTQFTDVNGNVQTIKTPYIVEEWATAINKNNMEGGHANTDQLAHIHFGGSYYIATDGSCQFFNEPPTDPNNSPAGACWCYRSIAPSRKLVQMGNSNSSWGWWDKQ